LRGAVEALQERPKNAGQVFMLLSLLRSIYKTFEFEGGSSFFDLQGFTLVVGASAPQALKGRPVAASGATHAGRHATLGSTVAPFRKN
jgi:hypothetical protein